MQIPAHPKTQDFTNAEGYTDWEDYDYARDQWEQEVGNMPELLALVPELTRIMHEDWETYHMVCECYDDKAKAVLLAKAGGDMTKALAKAKEYTDDFNEAQSNCY